MMKRSERAGARRTVLRQLKEIKDVLKTLDAWWNVTGRIYQQEPGHTSGFMRDRTPEEYPETQRRYWAGTARKIEQLIEMLEALHAYCSRQYHATPEDESK